MMGEKLEMTETLEYVYSSDSTQWEHSNEYQHDRVWIVFKIFCIFCAMDENSLRFTLSGDTFCPSLPPRPYLNVLPCG